jgi:hypothetical protein
MIGFFARFKKGESCRDLIEHDNANEYMEIDAETQWPASLHANREG